MLPNIEERKEPRAERDLEIEPMPLPELSTDLAILAMLNLIYDRTVRDEGSTPNLQTIEVDLDFVTGPRQTINADFNPDRWVIWFRRTSNANARLRMLPGDYVSGMSSVEVEEDQRITMAAKNENLSLENASQSDVDLHVFCVAIGGGSEFEIVGIGDGAAQT